MRNEGIKEKTQLAANTASVKFENVLDLSNLTLGNGYQAISSLRSAMDLLEKMQSWIDGKSNAYDTLNFAKERIKDAKELIERDGDNVDISEVEKLIDNAKANLRAFLQNPDYDAERKLIQDKCDRNAVPKVGTYITEALNQLKA